MLLPFLRKRVIQLLFQKYKIVMMKIEIWSDVRCPFCYIGKKKFEAALEDFPQRDDVKIIWRSFELDPNLMTTQQNTVDYFIETKGVTRSQAEQMLNRATEMADEVGLDFKLKEAIVANSFNAHRLIQLAKKHELGNEIEEALFKAHFIESKNIDDIDFLITTGVAVGLEEQEVREVMNSNAYADDVKQDQKEAVELGVQGVPFFVFDRKYSISGAQPKEAFLETLNKVFEEQPTGQ